MAKVGLTKITPIKNGDIHEIQLHGETIQVKSYLPVNEKIALTERVLARAFDDTNHYSKYRLDISFAIEVIRSYTNINITDKQLENLPALYDLLILNGIYGSVYNSISENEKVSLYNKVLNEADNLEHYLNSFAGVMKTITTDYSNTEMNVEQLTEKLNNPEALATVKQILDKIG